MQIIFDTNFLVYTAKYKIDFTAELNRICDFDYELAILDKSITELKKIKTTEFKVATYLIKDFRIINTSENKLKKVDDLLVEFSSPNVIIATQDKELKERLKKKGARLLIIRQKKYYQLN